MASRWPGKPTTAPPTPAFWDAWFALWAAAGAKTELARGSLAGRLKVIATGQLHINTLKGWIKQDPAARKKPRGEKKFLMVVAELRRHAIVEQHNRSGVTSWTDDHWRRVLANTVVNAYADNAGAEARVAEVSLSARELLTPQFLPNIDRMQELARAVGDRLAEIPTPLAVIGDGGLGKSVLLRQFYDSTSGDDADPSLRMLVLCSSIPSSADLSSAGAVDAALGAAATGDREAPSLTKLVDEIAARRPVLVLLDTVDLIVNDDNVDEVVHVLRTLAGAARLVFTCREQEYLNFLDTERGLTQMRYQLPMLNAEHVEHWARQYLAASGFDAEHNEAFINSLTRPGTTEVCATPLRLAMACDIYAPTGAIPDDLSVTELYNQYWQRRIAVDRRGKGTAASRAQEMAAEAIANEMWQASTHQFAVSAPGELVTNDAALQRLRSDGVLKQIGGRYQFFHQTYGEYAVARRLCRAGTTEDLHRLHAALERGTVAGLWPVARHLITLEMTDDRYAAVAEGIPLNEAEGVRLHFVGAFHRRNPDRVAALGETVDAVMLRSGVTVLADAPPECLASATELAIACLHASTSTDMELIAATCARLYTALAAEDRPPFLRRFLQAALARQPYLKKETLPSVVSRFIGNTVANDPEDPVVDVVIDFYVEESAVEDGGDVGRIELPDAARAALLKVVDAQPGSATLQTRLLSTAARRECPSGAVDAVSRLLVGNWARPEFRKAIGWLNVEGMLEDQLPDRWNACQVRLADALCEDVATAREVLAVAFSDAGLRRDRWANVAKYIADRHRDVVLETVLTLPDNLCKAAVGTACSVVNHVADALTAQQRAHLAKRLQQWINTDPRRVWPSLIKVSTDDTELLRRCARALHQLRLDQQTDSTPTILRSSFDTFLNACPPAQLAALEADLRPLLSADSKQDRIRSAELDGVIAEQSLPARGRVAGHLNGAATNAAFAATRGLVAALQCWDTINLDAQITAWIYELLQSRHANVVRLLAETLDAQADRIKPPAGAGITIADRLTKSVDDNDDTQTAGALLKLLILIDKRGALPGDRRTAVVDRLKSAVAERLPPNTPEPRRRHLPALFNLHKQALAALGISYYSVEETERAVGEVLTDVDIGDIANRSERTMAHLLITAAGRAASVVPLLEDLWPTVSDTNKGAIAECVMHLERNTAGVRSQRLARRDDCPISIKNEIYTRFPL